MEAKDLHVGDVFLGSDGNGKFYIDIAADFNDPIVKKILSFGLLK
ncbi:MAG: hypothetical protein ACRC2T_20485 [Thermoguttaceae bacterium]